MTGLRTGQGQGRHPATGLLQTALGGHARTTRSADPRGNNRDSEVEGQASQGQPLAPPGAAPPSPEATGCGHGRASLQECAPMHRASALTCPAFFAAMQAHPSPQLQSRNQETAWLVAASQNRCAGVIELPRPHRHCAEGRRCLPLYPDEPFGRHLLPGRAAEALTKYPQINHSNIMSSPRRSLDRLPEHTPKLLETYSPEHRPCNCHAPAARFGKKWPMLAQTGPMCRVGRVWCRFG